MAPKGLMILVELSDLSFLPNNTKADFDSLANGKNYVYNGATGSAQAYFKAQSNGQYVPQFDVVGPVKLHQTYAYYGKNPAGDYDQYIADFVIDAVVLAHDSLHVDFSQYDHDQDSEVDFVYLLYAGKGEADGGPSSTIWPLSWELKSALYYGYTNQSTYFYKSENNCNLPTFNGKQIVNFACSAELRSSGARSGIGTLCHEFTHVLGLPDYYITDEYAATMSRNTTPGDWSLMGSACYLNYGNTPCHYSVYDKFCLGWGTPQVLSVAQDVTLPADGKTYYMITRNGQMPQAGYACTDTVYYLENRQQTGWDTYLPGHGMLIWQVVYDDEMWENNTPNDYSTRYCLLTADHTPPYDAKGGAPYPGTQAVTSLQLFSYPLSHITEKDGVITFRFGEESPTDIATFSTDYQPSGHIRLENGEIVIYRNGKRYDLTGRQR